MCHNDAQVASIVKSNVLFWQQQITSQTVAASFKHGGRPPSEISRNAISSSSSVRLRVAQRTTHHRANFQRDILNLSGDVTISSIQDVILNTSSTSSYIACHTKFLS